MRASRICARNVVSVLAAAVALMIALAVQPAAAGAKNLDPAGVAIGGYDPVAYFTQSAPVRGKAEFAAVHDGATYRFSSAENRKRFSANPKEFIPAYGGYCAYAMAQGAKAPVDPEAFTIISGKLYLNFSKDVRRTWQADIHGYIAKADTHWSAFSGD